MQLFYSPTSPYARKCRIVARERGLMGEMEEVTCNPMSDPPELQSKNPLGKVPALILDDGTAIFDSPVIVEYLDGLGNAPALIPAAGAPRFKVLVAAALGQGVTDAAFLSTMESRRPEALQSAEVVARHRAAIKRSLDVMSGHLADLPGELTLGHISCAAALGYLDLRHGDLKWREGHDDLAAWFAEFDARPSMQETAPPA